MTKKQKKSLQQILIALALVILLKLLLGQLHRGLVTQLLHDGSHLLHWKA